MVLRERRGPPARDALRARRVRRALRPLRVRPGRLPAPAHRDSLRRGRVEARARRRIGIREAIEYGEDEPERIEALAGQTDWAEPRIGHVARAPRGDHR